METEAQVRSTVTQQPWVGLRLTQEVVCAFESGGCDACISWLAARAAGDMFAPCEGYVALRGTLAVLFL